MTRIYPDEHSQHKKLFVKSQEELQEKLRDQKRVEDDLRLAFEKLEKSRIASLNLMVDLRDEIDMRKKSEMFLRESEEKYRTLFTTMNEGFALHEIICDKNDKPIDYRFIDVNPAFEKLTGLKAEDIIGKTNMEVLPETEPYWIDTYGKVALTGKQINFENFSLGLGRYYQVSAYSPEPGKFATIFTDITERKRVEEELRLSREQYRILTENIKDVVWVMDAENFVFHVCQPFCGATSRLYCGRNYE